jgi:hypothetical protein
MGHRSARYGEGFGDNGRRPTTTSTARPTTHERRRSFVPSTTPVGGIRLGIFSPIVHLGVILIIINCRESQKVKLNEI